MILEEGVGEAETYSVPGTQRHSQLICDIRHLDALEQSQLIEMLKQAATVVVTLMYEVTAPLS